MPSLITTIKYAYKKHIQPRRARILHILKCILVILAISAAVEVCIFNFRAISSAFNKPIDISEKINLTQTADERYVVSSTQNVIELKDINENITALNLKMSKNQDAQIFNVKINFTDSGHSTFFDSTEYSVGIPKIEVSTASIRSQYFTIHPTGKVRDMRLQIYGEDLNYPVYIDSIIANPQYPFNFLTWRFFALFAIMFLLYIFRLKSSVYKIKLVDRPLYTRAVICLTVAVQSLLLWLYLLMGCNLVGVATSEYNFGDWDGVSAVNTFEVGGDNAQQYAELAKAFTKGQLYLCAEPPDYLKTMDDPYDKGSRDEMEKQTGQKYLFDVAYYDGHYYVYFGVVPVLLFYLPFYLITGANFPTAVGVLIMSILFIIGISVLLDRFARYHFKRVSLGLYLLLQIPLVMCSGILYICKFPTFYSLPIACGVAFAV